MQITDVAARIVTPKRITGTTSTVKQVDESTCVLLELTASDGSVGIGEIPDIEHPDKMPSTSVIESELMDFFAGEDLRRINYLTKRMESEINFGPFEFHSFQQLALGAVDTALFDLLGTHYGIPAYQLLGGKTREVPICWVVYTERSNNRFAELESEITEKVEQGFTNFKLKVGETDLDTDERRIQTVREIAGEDANVFIDPQGVWDLETAIENVCRFEEVGIDGVETPVGHPNHSVDAVGHYYDIPLLPEELATLRRQVKTPIMEHVLDPMFAFELVAANAVDIFTVEACAGGLNRAHHILQIAESAGIDARLGSTVELGPGTLAGAALAASSNAVTYPCDLIGPLVYADNVLENPIEYKDGMLDARDQPGLGITLRES